MAGLGALVICLSEVGKEFEEQLTSLSSVELLKTDGEGLGSSDLTLLQVMSLAGGSPIFLPYQITVLGPSNDQLHSASWNSPVVCFCPHSFVVGNLMNALQLYLIHSA